MGPQVRTEYKAWGDSHKGRIGQQNDQFDNYGNRTTSVQTVGWSPYTMKYFDYSANSFIIFFLYSYV
jgi:hypothetical protein